MKTSSRHFGSVLAVLAVSAGIVLQGQAQGFSALKLVATPEKAQLVPGEPLVLQFRLTNPTAAPVTAHRALDPEIEMIQVFLASPDSGFKRYLGPRWGISERRPKALQIAPGEILSGETSILFNQVIQGDQEFLQSQLPVSAPGSYRIRVEFYDLGYRQKITAPVIEIALVKPVGPAASIWEQMMAEPELAYFLQTGDARKGSAIVQQTEQLVRQNPDTIQAKHFALALGKHYQRQSDFPKAAGYFQQAAEAASQSLLRGQALLELTKSLFQRRDFEQSRKLCDSAIKEFAQTGMRQKFATLCAELNTLK